MFTIIVIIVLGCWYLAHRFFRGLTITLESETGKIFNYFLHLFTLNFTFLPKICRLRLWLISQRFTIHVIIALGCWYFAYRFFRGLTITLESETGKIFNYFLHLFTLNFTFLPKICRLRLWWKFRKGSLFM